SHGEGDREGPVRHGGGHTGHHGILFPTQLELLPYLFPGEPEQGPAAPGIPTAGVVGGGAERILAGHLLGPGSHPHAPVVVRVERGKPSMPNPAAPVEIDQGGAATAQPNPTASPSSPRPPGAAGPGRPVSGSSGPGLPGPGRPAIPRS
ncbi:MAG: hypothetical protein ACLQVF_20260, partial [Isosphaeraceae bacterium]